MSSKHLRLGAAVAVTAATLGIVGTASPANALEPTPPFPPIGCGVVHHEVGPVSSLIHALEKPLFYSKLGLAEPVHGVNCTIVLQAEYLLGLQTRPVVGGPFG